MTKIEKIVLATIGILVVVVAVSAYRVKKAIDEANPKTMLEELDTRKVGEWFGEKTKGLKDGFEAGSSE